MRSLKEKVTLITGASKGIGRATAIRLAKAGANIVAAATHVDHLEELNRELSGMGVKTLSARCDVTRLSDCEDLLKQALDVFDRIDILVNNAGIGFSGNIADSDPEEMKQTIMVNILGVYYMTRSVLPAMIARQSGDIVNLGSVAAIKYSPGFAVYSATKYAVRSFSEALRNEVQPHNIRVALIHPGMTRTPFFDSFARDGSPLPVDRGEILEPVDVADAIHYALTRPQGVALNELTVRPSWQER